MDKNKDTNTGDWNRGNCNTGDGNTGDGNTGNRNTGDWNTGNWNTGVMNTGVMNTGDKNTGDRNTGDKNTGDWNSSSYHTGCFNTNPPEKAYYFNKLINKSEWDRSRKPHWLFEAFPVTWIFAKDMTKQEKQNNPNYTTTGGYLRVNDMKQQWFKAYSTASLEDIQAVLDLPGFDAEIFLEITGIDFRDKTLEAPCEGREVEIDGVTYILKTKEKV